MPAHLTDFLRVGLLLGGVDWALPYLIRIVAGFLVCTWFDKGSCFKAV